jgi:hypothetical protein
VGIYEYTGVAADVGKFKAPTLRNIAITVDGRRGAARPAIRQPVLSARIAPGVSAILKSEVNPPSYLPYLAAGCRFLLQND